MIPRVQADLEVTRPGTSHFHRTGKVEQTMLAMSSFIGNDVLTRAAATSKAAPPTVAILSLDTGRQIRVTIETVEVRVGGPAATAKEIDGVLRS